MSEFLEWEDAEGMAHKMRFVGLTPLAINDGVHFATKLFIEKEHDMQSFGGGQTVVSASAISGDMLLFSQPGFPNVWDDDGVPEPATIELTADDRALRLDQVLFSKKQTLPGYEKCDAAYVEWVAEGMSMAEITKSINRRVTI